MLMTAECLGTEASAAYLAQDPGALALAEGALATCRALKASVPTTEARLLAILGNVHSTNKNWQAAIDAYELAIAAGDVIQDLRRLSLIYSDLSVAHQELGRFNEAARYAHRAIGIHETLSDRLSLARSENNLGMLLLRRGDLADAQAHFERALSLFEDAGVEPQRANMLMSMCELNFLRGDLEAGRAIQQGLSLTPFSAHGRGYSPPEGLVDPSLEALPNHLRLVMKMKADEFLANLAAEMDVNPPSSSDRPLLDRLETIGLSPGRPFEWSKLPEEVQEALEAGVADSREVLASPTTPLRLDNGWQGLREKFGPARMASITCVARRSQPLRSGSRTPKTRASRSRPSTAKAMPCTVAAAMSWSLGKTGYPPSAPSGPWSSTTWTRCSFTTPSTATRLAIATSWSSTRTARWKSPSRKIVRTDRTPTGCRPRRATST